MLYLKRIVNFNDFVKDMITNETLSYGDYYYEDDTDGFTVGAITWRRMKEQQRRDKFVKDKLTKLQDQRSYAQALKQAQKEYLYETLLDREVAKYQE
jgi:hypothetical protein